MRRSTKFAIGGSVLAVAIGSVGFLNTYRLERHEAALSKECKEKPDPWNQFKDAGPPPVGFVMDPLICDADKLVSLDTTYGLQSQIVDAHYAVQSSRELPSILASIVFAISLIPMAWYFLLRRVVELRTAIGGKPPAD